MMSNRGLILEQLDNNTLCCELDLLFSRVLRLISDFFPQESLIKDLQEKEEQFRKEVCMSCF